MDKIFREHTPDIVLHAAAHKHVLLMERNVIEAVRNNVFGTLNVVEACEKYGVKRFIMVSTDKAVNPTKAATGGSTNTGDESHAGVWMWVLMAAAFMVTGCGLALRKKGMR